MPIAQPLPASGPATAPPLARVHTGRVCLTTPSPTLAPSRFHCILVEAGLNLNNWAIPKEVLAQAVTLFSGAPCLIDHPGFLDFPSLRNLAGTFEDPTYYETPGGAYIAATLRLASTPSAQLLQEVFTAWLDDFHAGLQVPPIGLSAVLSVKMNYDNGEPICSAIAKVWSVDAVLHPAAGGRVERVLNSTFPTSTTSGGFFTMADRLHIPESDVSDTPLAMSHPVEGRGEGNGGEGSSDPLAEIMARMDQISQRIDALTPPAREPSPPTAQPQVNEPSQVRALARRLDSLEQRLAQDANPIEGLGSAATIEGSTLIAGHSGLEQLQLAFEALLAGTRPQHGIQPLTGIREAYNLLSGDYEMTGVFNPDRVYLANVTCSTMANLVANVLNKRVVAMFQNYPHWWDKIVTVEDFNTLQDVRWITLGGVGELPTVAEGATYTELTWDDDYQTDSFVKKGGYLGLTIEAIDKDDTGRLRAAPRALAQAAWLTLSKSVSAIFTSNSGAGPNINVGGTSRALFHASNNNLGTSALSFSSYVATRTAMRQQTELNSGERLGALTAPKFLLVPPDLEVTALQILASAGEPGTADNDINPLAIGNTHDALIRNAKSRVIVVDLWTDANNWAAVADPNMYPSIGLGYRYGRTPEIFSVASPTAGLMFTNDTMPVKVRYFFAVGPIDYRGLYKHNVS